jgi:hypothetical protein
MVGLRTPERLRLRLVMSKAAVRVQADALTAELE